MRPLLLICVLGLTLQVANAATFTPYISDDDEDYSSLANGGASLQNWRDPDTGAELTQYPTVEGTEIECTTCGSDETCLDAVYNAGVLPVDKNGDGVADYYEFPGCTDANCPLHHLGGWAAESDGSISSIKNDRLGGTDQAPELPVGEPFIMLLFAGAYAYMRRRKAGE